MGNGEQRLPVSSPLGDLGTLDLWALSPWSVTSSFPRCGPMSSLDISESSSAPIELIVNTTDRLERQLDRADRF
jgi:hypothetical protein